MRKIGEKVKVISGPGLGIRGTVAELSAPGEDAIGLRVESGQVWWFKASDVGSLHDRVVLNADKVGR